MSKMQARKKQRELQEQSIQSPPEQDIVPQAKVVPPKQSFQQPQQLLDRNQLSYVQEMKGGNLQTNSHVEINDDQSQDSSRISMISENLASENYLTSSKSEVIKFKDISEVTADVVKNKLGDLQHLLDNLKRAKIEIKNHVDANKSQLRRHIPTLDYESTSQDSESKKSLRSQPPLMRPLVELIESQSVVQKEPDKMPQNARQRYIWAKDKELNLKKLNLPPTSKFENHSQDSDDNETESNHSQKHLKNYQKNSYTVFNHDRCLGKIPDYDNSQVQVFEDAEPKIQSKELDKLRQLRLTEQIERMNINERISLLGKIMPEFQAGMSQMRTVALKYNTLTKRLSAGPSSAGATALSIWGAKVKEYIQSDKFVQKVRLTEDILTNKHLSQMTQSELDIIQGENSNQNEEGVQDNQFQIQRDNMRRDLNGVLMETDMKMKDSQMRRLQAKVRDYITVEKDFRTKIKTITARNETLIGLLEQAVCFGKILFVSRPVLSQNYKHLEQKIIKSFRGEMQHRLEIQRKIEENKDDFQRQNDLLHPKDDVSQLSEQQVLLDCLKASIEEEFVTLSQMIFNQEWFNPKQEMRILFSVMTPELLSFYKDVQVSELISSFQADALQFIDLGISIMNDQKKEKWIFVKMVHRNQMPSGRDVYLMAIQSDQAFKWEKCLQFKQPDFVDLIFDEIQRDLQLQFRQAKILKKGGTIIGRPRGLTRSPQQESDPTTDDENSSNTGFTLKSGLTSEEKELRKKKEKEKNEQRKTLVETLSEAYENLINGVVFIKYGKWGKPKARHVFMQDKFICWRDPKEIYPPTLPKIVKPPKTDKIKPSADTNEQSDLPEKIPTQQRPLKTKVDLGKRNIAIKDIKKIVEGRQSKQFAKYTNELAQQLSFSIISEHRSLDLEASNEIEKRIFIKHLQLVIDNPKLPKIN